MIDVAPEASCSYAHSASCWIDTNPFHQGKIDHQSAVASSQAGPIVAAAANRSEKFVFASIPDGSHYVGHINRAHNELRALVDHSVVDFAGRVVRGIFRLDYLSPDGCL